MYSLSIAGHGRPPHADRRGVRLGLPGVADAAEHDVGAGPVQDQAAIRQVDPEPSADQEYGRGTRFGADPLRPLVAARVDTPLDLDVPGLPRIAGRHEMAEYPAAVLGAVGVGIPGVDQPRVSRLSHGRLG